MNEYTKVVKELIELQPIKWIEFETFRKNIIVTKELKNAPASVPAVAVKSADELCISFNLQERYNQSFEIFK